ncbi:phasin PhaH [uncultured Caulobacter sp.]|uniref:phasin PhaH n=1 Tax=uncultured Caulobacter sp. TaxID=158749 RepID=UPI00262B7635|nr:phasin PhaH [uncultured Caulobacter sp.]
MVSLFSFLPDYAADKVEPETAPRVVVGAASPLWLMFGGAAAAGATYWWWANRWREAVNVEALMALAPEPVSPAIEDQAVLDAPPEPMIEAAVEPVLETVVEAAGQAEAAMDTAEEIIEATADVAVETVIAANEDIAEALVEISAEVEPSDVAPVEAAPVEAVSEEAPVEAVVEAAPAIEAEAVVEAVVDDLTKLVGVGPKLAASLAELGVTKFSQIAAWTPDELASYDQLLNLKGRAERDAWVAQAKRFAAAVEA